MQKIEYSKQNLFCRVPILILLTVKMKVERLNTSRGATLEVRLLAEDICFCMYKIKKCIKRYITERVSRNLLSLTNG